MNNTRIAIVSNRYINNDLRGSEEFPKQLFDILKFDYTVDILTSDIIDLQPLTSPLSHRIKRSQIKLDEFRNIYRFKTHPLISSSSYIANKLLSCIRHEFGENMGYFSDYLHVIGWGPLTSGISNHIAAAKYDLIHGSTFPSTPSYFAFEAAKKYHIPYVYAPYLHYRLSEFYSNELLKKMVRKSDAVIARTDTEKRQLILLGSNDKRVFVIPSMFNISISDKFREDKIIAKEKLGLGGKFVILTVPHILKGGIQTLEAAAKLSDQLDGVCVVSIGNIKKNYKKTADLLLRKHKNLSKIDFGWVNTEVKYLIHSSADVFSMPSITDSFGLSYLDSWSCLTPVIAAKDTSANDIVRHAIDGFLVEYGNVEELTNYFKSLYQDSELSKYMGFKGYRKILEKFNPVKVKNQYIEAFEHAMQQPYRY